MWLDSDIQHDFNDVTLVTSDSVTIEAHKVILTTGSPIFRNISPRYIVIPKSEVPLATEDNM